MPRPPRYPFLIGFILGLVYWTGYSIGAARADCTFTAMVGGSISSGAVAATISGSAIGDCIPPAPPPSPVKSYCCRLAYASPTQLRLALERGDLLAVNGVNATIPPSGIAGCGNAGVLVNGATGSLAAS